jgi:fumarylacetoacetase
MISANDPSLRSWIEVPAGSDFPIQNLPFGIIRPKGQKPRAAVAIGEYALDLYALANAGLLEVSPKKLERDSLNSFIGLGKPVWRAVRNRISELLRDNNPTLRDDAVLRKKALFRRSEVETLLPVFVRDYTDFYSSIEHATNVGIMFRGKENALMPNWKHLPVGYHGRASSIIASGTPIHRPKGQTRPDEAQPPVYGPTRLLDFELEMAFIIGKSTKLGSQVSTAKADDHIFGLALLNDWSARDIQKWEYVPLGPFLGKSFASSISPWIVTLDALEPFRVSGPKQDPEVLPYLKYEGDKNLDIQLEVAIQPKGSEETVVCRSNHKYLYWNMEQQVAHHTVNGCNLNVGDMMASGTISGPEEGSYGSMLEITWRGSKPVTLADGSERKFIEDGDSVIIRGFSEKEGVRIGFGELKTKVLPAF